MIGCRHLSRQNVGGIVSLLRTIRSYSTGKSIRIIPVIPNVETNAYEQPYNVFDRVFGRRRTGINSISGTSANGWIRERRRSASHLFYSKDLTHWEYLHPLLIDDVFCDLGEDGAVPNFLPIGNGKHILLLFSHKRSARYYIGEYDQVAPQIYA